MSEFTADGFPLPITIRFDGLDASSHLIEMSDLATSLKGLSRIITVAGTFATDQRLIERSKARPVRVMVGPPREGCVIVQAVLMWLDQHAFAASTISGLTVLLVGYVFKRAAGQREEMKQLREALETAIKELGHRDEPVISRLLDTVDRMADVLKPAVRQAVTPIGRSAGTMTVGGSGASGRAVFVDKAERDAIDAQTEISIGVECDLSVRFTEMNLESRTCRLAVDETDVRIPADITDPEILLPNNAYAAAFAAQEALMVRAKPTMQEGEVVRWYISGHAEAPAGSNG